MWYPIRKHSISKQPKNLEILIVDLSTPEQTSSDLVDYIQEQVQKGHLYWVLNCQKLTRLDEELLANLLAILKIIYEYEGTLKLCCLETDILHMLHSLKLDILFTLDSTEQKSLKSFS